MFLFQPQIISLSHALAVDFDLNFILTSTLPGTKACPLACGACEACAADTLSSKVGSTDANDCIATTVVIGGCNKPFFLSRAGSDTCDYW
jgi:hypothetical protein